MHDQASGCEALASKLSDYCGRISLVSRIECKHRSAHSCNSTSTMMRAAVRSVRALRGARQLHTPLAHGQQASAAKRLLAAAGLATGAAACYATAQSTATCESAAAAKTRFDENGFGSPSFKGDVVIVTGGTTGIGAACCAHLAKAGGVVYNIDFKAPAASGGRHAPNATSVMWRKSSARSAPSSRRTVA